MAIPVWRVADCPNDECGRAIAIVVDEQNPVTHFCGHCWTRFVLVKRPKDDPQD